MGFLDGLLSGLSEAGASAYRRKVESMSIQQLTDEWNRLFKNRGYSDYEYNLYQDSNRIDSILDEVYNDRTGKTMWLQNYKKEKRKRDEAEKAKEAELEGLRKFYASLDSNEMVQEIIKAINDCGYDAEQIHVCEDHVRYGDEWQRKGSIIYYRNYGYPDLSTEQTWFMGRYIGEHLKLKFNSNESCTYFELNDVPNGWKSW